MNDRSRNERNRGEAQWRDRGRGDERGWHDPQRGELRAESREPQYSSDEDETYGSEWSRGAAGSFDRDYSYDDEARRHGASQGRESQGSGRAGQYGSGGRGGQPGGYGANYHREPERRFGSSQGYGGSQQGYGGSQQGYGGNQQGYGGNQQGYGGSQGRSSVGGYYGGTGFGGGAQRRFGRDQALGQERGFGVGFDEGFRGRDVGSPGADPRARGGFSGRGPKGYTRTDDRIREDVCESLSQDDDVDASEIEVTVKDAEVTLQGTVLTRRMKHLAEDIAEGISGVNDVHNELKVMKGMLSELKDKITGDDHEQHFANSGTKNSPVAGSAERSS